MTWSKRSKVLAATGGVVLLLAVVAAAFLPRIARWAVVREARSRGIEIEVDSLDVGWSSVRLRGVRFRLDGVVVVHGSAATVNLEHVLLTPRSVAGEGLELSLEGTIVRELVDWAKRFPGAFSVPATMGVAKIEWRKKLDGDVTVRLTRGELDVSPEGGRLRDAVLDLGPLGLKLDAGWRLSAQSLDVGLLGTDVATAPLRASVTALPTADRVVAHFDQRAVAVVDPFLALERIALPKGVEAEGELELMIKPAPQSMTGSASVRLKGWIPPHPKELDGIVFGNVTTIAADFSYSGMPDTTPLVDIRRIALKAGTLDLSGTGTVEPRPLGPTVLLSLSGQIACSELAVSALAARLPDIVSDFGGKLARRSLTGSALVFLSVEAELGALHRARVTPSVTPRCKLKLL